MSELLSLIVNGAVSGAIYAIMASGLVLTYQTSGIFNFAHGAIAFCTAYLFFQLNQPVENGGNGWPVVPSAIVAILVFAPLVGLALDRVMMRRLAAAPETARVVGTIGLLIALPAFALWLVETLDEVLDWTRPTNEQVFLPPGLGPVPKRTWSVMEGVALDSNQVAIFVAAAVSALVLWFVLRRTRLGLSTRASVDRRGLAALRGVDTDRTSAAAWVLSSTLAGLAGVVIAPVFQLDSLVYLLLVFASFAAVVFAGLRSIPLGFLGGLLLGVVQNLVNGYAPDLLTRISGFRSAVPFLLLLGLLLVPRSRSRAAGTMAEEVAPPDHRASLPPWRRRLPWAVATGVLVVYVQWVADDFWAGLVTKGLVLSLIFLSFVVVTGMGGMVSLAQAAFVTAGGFTCGWLVNHQWARTMPLLMDNGRFHFFVAALAAALVAALVGVLVALPSLRLGGLHLALATLALAFIGDLLVFQLDGVRNGSAGWSVRAPEVGPFDLADTRTMAMALLVVVGLVTLLIHNLARSASGRAIFAVRSSEVAARTAGISPVRTRLSPFAVSAGIAGFGGAMYAAVNSPVTNTSNPALVGLIWLAVTVTFGVRRPGGAIVAGIVFALLPSFLSGVASWPGAPWSWIPGSVRTALDSSHVVPMLFGLGAISLAREPDGVLAMTGHRIRDRRLARRRRAGERARVEATDLAAEAPVATPGVAPATEPVPEPAALRLEHVHAGYGDVEVLHDVTLDVPRGAVVALLGANGAGKSTLCAVAAGLLAPTGGRVLRDGVNVTDRPAFRRAREGLLLAPEARGVFPGLTVEDNLALWLRSGADREPAYRRFPILRDRRRQFAGLLSGGEQQMLAMAPALAEPPRVLVADEPSLGLAPLAAEEVFAALAELRGMGVAILLVEEKASEALELADVVAFMELGRVTWVGPRAEADADRLTAAYLGVAPA